MLDVCLCFGCSGVGGVGGEWFELYFATAVTDRPFLGCVVCCLSFILIIFIHILSFLISARDYIMAVIFQSTCI